MYRKSIILHCLLFLFLLIVLVACSKQEESKTTPPTSTSVPESMPAETAADLEKAPDATSENKQATENIQPAAPETNSTMETKADASAGDEPAMKSGHEEELALARKSGCLACHAVDKKIVGPPWRDVSKRYLNDTNAKEKLIAKVKKGGRGNWTEVVGPAAMPPYSPRVSDEDITKLVEFVLALEK